MRRWYLGIHRSNWLTDPRLAEVPVFVSRNVFPKGQLPRAVGPYAIDSGGFTELQRHGRWTITPRQYVAFLRRCRDEVGPYDFAAPMDLMCERAVIDGGWWGGQHFAGTGLTVAEHQRRTVGNYLELTGLAPDLDIIPVVQGDSPDSHRRCADLYSAAGIDLSCLPVVGVGSVCRIQNTDKAAEIIDALADHGVRNMHGFGFKVEGLRRCWDFLATADSMSWSKDGRHAGPCQHPPYAKGFQPRSEANCLPYALAWRRRHVRRPLRPYERQLSLFPAA